VYAQVISSYKPLIDVAHRKLVLNKPHDSQDAADVAMCVRVSAARDLSRLYRHDLPGDATAPPSPQPPKAKAAGHKLGHTLEWRGGVAQVTPGQGSSPAWQVRGLQEFIADLAQLTAIVKDAALVRHAENRLTWLDTKMDFHLQMNAEGESKEVKVSGHRDFYNVRKVDVVEAAFCVNKKQLVRFIRAKAEAEAEQVVLQIGGQRLTLTEVFARAGVAAREFNVDHLVLSGQHQPGALPRRTSTDPPARRGSFPLPSQGGGDVNPVEAVFLNIHNEVKGRYFAELLQGVARNLAEEKYQLMEVRLTVFDATRMRQDWAALAAWFLQYEMQHANMRWLIQVAPVYAQQRAAGTVASFDEYLRGLFAPLFAVSMDPASDPALHQFMQQVVAIDLKESIASEAQESLGPDTPPPGEWTALSNPPYEYYLYHIWANLNGLNRLRHSRGLNTLKLRPHCGESRDSALGHTLAGGPHMPPPYMA
jgi:AMP deaminase